MITFTFELHYRPTFGGHDKWDGGSRCNYRTRRSDSVDVWKFHDEKFHDEKIALISETLERDLWFRRPRSFFLFRIGLQIPADYYVATQTHHSKFHSEKLHGRIGS